ncbi:MAG: Dabb family protein [Chloroflexota bacterium]
MIRHVVMFKFKDDASNDDRAGFVEMLYKLADEVPQVRQLEVGNNFTDSPRACDLVLVVDLDDEAALKAYAAHPNHQPVLQRAGEVCAASYVVDYTLA